MNIAAYLMVTLLAVVPEIECTFRRRPSANKHKGPFGGHLASWGSTALDGFLRYAPGFYDVVPKVARKLLKKHRYEDDHPFITMKHINRPLKKSHVAPLPVHPAHHGSSFGGFDDFGFDGFDGGYGHYPLVIPHNSFHELPVHGVIHEPIDFTHSFESPYSHGLHIFDHGYQL